MPTRDRLRFLPGAIQCFRSQTYPLARRELLIAEDGAASAARLIPNDLPITLFRVDGQQTVGAKRNFLCQQVHGEIIIHFDDDDWSGPGRIAAQVAMLQGTAQVSGFNQLEFRSDNGDRWLYSGRANYALGTSLCYRRSWWQAHQFPHVQVGEDTEFSARAAQRGVLVAEAAGPLMWARIHPGNTSAKVTTGRPWRRLA